jgi:phage shock protein E
MGFFDKLFGSNNNDALAEVVSKGAFLVDVREPAEVASGRVKGAVNIPLGTIQNNLAKFKNKEHIVVFCRSGNRSGMAKSILEQNGFTNVTNGGTWDNVASLLS